MPNHVANKIQFNGKQANIDKVLELIKGKHEGQYIDFEKIIPMPENIFRGNLGLEEEKLYGKNNWYDWSIEHWGTKWNAYDIGLGMEDDDNVITFNTAWSCPLPVLDTLAEICYKHDVFFTGKWADEDCGCNVGIFESDCDGDEYWFSYEKIESRSNEAYEIYVELHGESCCLAKDEDGNWYYRGCDDCPNPC